MSDVVQPDPQWRRGDPITNQAQMADWWHSFQPCKCHWSDEQEREYVARYGERRRERR